MSCPKCKAKIGVMQHEIILETGVVQFTRCILCGYWSNPYESLNRATKTVRSMEKS